MLPDLSNTDKMAAIGRAYVLRQARRKAAQRLRDTLIPILNNIEAERGEWDTSGIIGLVSEIEQLSEALRAMERPPQ
jgi:NADH:ubiquinone oxidoreductase subunit E